jgi:hypothetical protein
MNYNYITQRRESSRILTQHKTKQVAEWWASISKPTPYRINNRKFGGYYVLARNQNYIISNARLYKKTHIRKLCTLWRPLFKYNLRSF